MSSILRGLNENEMPTEANPDQMRQQLSELDKAADKAKYALDEVDQATRVIKYGTDTTEIIVAVQGIADTLGTMFDHKELHYYEDKVREANNALESAVYGLREPFNDLARDLRNKHDELEMDIEDLDEGQRCWKGYKKQGTKMMFGKRVNNCVKADESLENVADDIAKDLGKQEWDAAMGENIDIDDAFEKVFKDRKRDPKHYDKGPTPAPRKPRSYDKGPEKKSDMGKIMSEPSTGYNFESSKKSSMGKVMEMYDDYLFLIYINGKLAAETPIEKKQKNQYERVITQALPDAEVTFKPTPRHYYSADQLTEGTGRIRAAIFGIALISAMFGINNKMAQETYEKSHQLQQLTQVYAHAKQCGDEAKMKDVERRMGNHKMRLDLGKGDVDFDGRPGKDDIKDINYIKTSCEVN